MRVLILGGAGLLGHKLYQLLQSRFSVFAAVRKPSSYYHSFGIFDPETILGEVDLRHAEDLVEVLSWSQPDVVVNAVGIIKQRREAEDQLQSLEINSLLPHRLALICRSRGSRLIHISTDCVFSGRDGNYTEEAISDALDFYGKTKYLGEVQGERTLTLRTSFIGREIETSHGLLEWFLAQRRQSCRGFSKAIFSGLTTIALAGLVGEIIDKHRDLSGLFHLSSDPISKYDLLSLINEIYRLEVRIERDDGYVCDRSLDSSRFRAATGWRPASWQAMVLQMREDPTDYDTWKKE